MGHHHSVTMKFTLIDKSNNDIENRKKNGYRQMQYIHISRITN